MILLLFLYGTKSRENNGPNGQPAQCMTPSEFYKNRHIQRYWPATNWILCLCFCCGSTVLVTFFCDSLVYCKVRWTVITKCDSFFITNCDKVYYKLRQVLQSAMDLLQIATDITKCDDYYKLRQYKRLERRTCNSEVPSSSPILTASWIGFR